MLSCELYDNVEVCCIYRLPIKIRLHNGQTFQGVASNCCSRDGVELLCLQRAATANKNHLEIPLKDISYLEALNNNPYFDRANFTP